MYRGSTIIFVIYKSYILAKYLFQSGIKGGGRKIFKNDLSRAYL